ncbi:MAG: hypothetical protein ACKOA8_10935 [Deltaproteobacteria bacterium]
MVKGVTQRDLALFKSLGDFGVLSTAQVRELNFKEIRTTTMLRRLRVLEEKDQIRRIHGLPDGSHGWCLTVTCARTFGIQGVFRQINRTSLIHDVTLSEIRLKLKSVGLGDTWVAEHILRYRAWENRIKRRRVAETIPDGIFTIEHKGEHLAVAVELEINQKTTERYQKSFRAYDCKRNLGMVWYLVPHLALGRRLESIWKKIPSADTAFTWSLISNVINNPYDIELHRNGQKQFLREVTAIHRPAQSSAQGVSRF